MSKRLISTKQGFEFSIDIQEKEHEMLLVINVVYVCDETSSFFYFNQKVVWYSIEKPFSDWWVCIALWLKWPESLISGDEKPHSLVVVVFGQRQKIGVASK